MGWGENDRRWFDDVFWMDFLIQGVGWVLVVLSISVTALIFYRQRQAAIADRNADAQSRRDDAREIRLYAAREKFAVESDKALQQVVNCLNQLTDGLRSLVRDNDSTGPSLEDMRSFRIAMSDLAKACGQWFGTSVALIPNNAFRDGPMDEMNTALNHLMDEFTAEVQKNDLTLTLDQEKSMSELIFETKFLITTYRYAANTYVIDNHVGSIATKDAQAELLGRGERNDA